MFKKVISKFLVPAVVLSIMVATPAQAAKTYDVPSDSDFKSFMDYRTITDITSEQYKIQQQCITDENGFRVCDGKYCIALGNGFNVKAGDVVTVELANGSVFDCIVSDVKRNRDTGADNMQVNGNGNVVEFVVDVNKLDDYVKLRGTVSVIDGMDGDVVSITTYEGYEEDLITQGLVINKSDLELPTGEHLYTIDYIAGEDNSTNTCTVDKETYEDIAIMESVFYAD